MHQSNIPKDCELKLVMEKKLQQSMEKKLQQSKEKKLQQSKKNPEYLNSHLQKLIIEKIHISVPLLDRDVLKTRSK